MTLSFPGPSRSAAVQPGPGSESLLLGPLGLTLVGAAQLLDFLTFVGLVRAVGLGGEANPLVRALFHLDGLATLFAAKLALWALVAAVAAVLTPRWPVLARLVVVMAVVGGLLGTVTNLASF